MNNCKGCDRYERRIKRLEEKRALLERRLETLHERRRKDGFFKRIGWFIKNLLER